MSEAERIEQLIEDITEQVRAADSLDDALAAVTLALRDPYKLWRTSVWTFVPPDAALLRSSWAVGDTEFEPGMQVRFSLTSDVEFLATSVMAGKPMMMRTAERDLGLLTDLLKREGIGSAVMVPLGRKVREPVGLMVLASSRSDVFRSKDVRFAAALARSLSHRMTDLVQAIPGER